MSRIAGLVVAVALLVVLAWLVSHAAPRSAETTVLADVTEGVSGDSSARLSGVPHVANRATDRTRESVAPPVRGQRAAVSASVHGGTSSPAVGDFGRHTPAGTPTDRSGYVPVLSGPLVGLATWYRYRPGQGAAGPALRRWLGSWRGSIVRVCATACVNVRLTDWCACGHGRIVDLDARLFRQLAPLSRGVIHVTISGNPAAPATDPEISR